MPFQPSDLLPGFAGREPPHGLEPIGDKLFGTVHDGTGNQGMMVLTHRANITVAGTNPVLGVAAPFTGEATRPFLAKQIIVARLWI